MELSHLYLCNWKRFTKCHSIMELACNSRLILWKCFSEKKKDNFNKRKWILASTRLLEGGEEIVLLTKSSCEAELWPALNEKNVRDTPNGEERAVEEHKFERQTDRQKKTDEQTDNRYLSNLYLSFSRNPIKWRHYDTHFSDCRVCRERNYHACLLSISVLRKSGYGIIITA